MIRNGYHITSVNGRYEIDPDDGTCAFCLRHTSVVHVRDTDHDAHVLVSPFQATKTEYTFSICSVCIELIRRLTLDGNEA